MNAMDSTNKTNPTSIEAADVAHGDHCFAKMDAGEFAAIVKHALEEFLGRRGAITLQISSSYYFEVGTLLSLTIGDAEFELMVNKND